MGFVLIVAAIITLIALGIHAGASGAGFSAVGGVCSLIMGMGGLQLIGIGIVGQYLGKLYLEGKRRPVYILRETEDGLVK